jgi:NADH:ubiquinone oxidoreductase subunit E
MNTSEGTLPARTAKYIDECRSRPNSESYLIPVLQHLQNEVGYLSPEHMEEVSQRMQVPSAKVSGVASFYHFFTFKPKGRYRVTLCMGTACFVRGADRVLERLGSLLGIEVGETTADGMFSIECARCLGACALAPVMLVNERVYGNVKPGDVAGILAEYGFVEKEATA